MKIYSKIHSIQKGLVVHKDKRNEFLKNAYVTLDQIVEKLEPLLEKENLFMFHNIVDRELVTHIVDIEGQEELVSHFPMNATDPQKAGSEITYWKRYNLSAIFNIIADEDDDWNKASGIWAKNTSTYTQNTPKVWEPTEWMNKPQIEQLFKELHEWVVTAWNSGELVKKARLRWKVSKATEWEIATRYQKEFI